MSAPSTPAPTRETLKAMAEEAIAAEARYNLAFNTEQDEGARYAAKCELWRVQDNLYAALKPAVVLSLLEDAARPPLTAETPDAAK